MKFETVEDAIGYLKKHGFMIGDQAMNGDKLAYRVFEMYHLHYKCPSDPGAQGLLITALEDYTKKEKGVVNENRRSKAKN